MSGAIEDIAKRWLAEPSYSKVFKHTFDVIEDYLCYGLTAAGSIALAVRFLTSLGSGEVVCVIQGVSHNASTKDLGPYPSGSTNTLIQYANHHQGCADSALTVFMQYLPFVLLLQAVSIILVEKMLMKFPRVSGKIERFYGTIVEESLFGKDPDVAEDVFDDKANSEAISRRRQRNEVCMGLKRSSIIHHMYIGKNVLEICLLLFFIPFNFAFGVEAEINLTPSKCVINIGEVPEMNLEAGQVFFQCEGKKVNFFLWLLYVQIATMILVVLCSSGSLVWCLYLRSVSKLLTKIERDHPDWDIVLEETQGEDFLFLFDLLSHTSGIESTLRVLTHADDTFRKICLPKIINDIEHVRVEEDKLRVVWDAAPLELWLKEHSHKGIQIDSYDITIFPAETVNHSKTLLPSQKDARTGRYTAWFYDLQGGKTEYVITIACVIGKSRMKGERIVTTLLPYGPEKPRAGILKSSTTDEVEIAWEPPKGGFTKYKLSVDPSVSSVHRQKCEGILNPNMFYARKQESQESMNSMENQDTVHSAIHKDNVTHRELSSLLTDHKISGLSPGCTYGIELKTITGNRQTRQSIFECVMTRPLPPESFTKDKVSTTSALLQWVPPEGNKRLKAFNISIQSNDNKVKKELAVKHQADATLGTFLLTSIPSGTEYTVSITAVAVFETLKTLSETKKMTFSTRPEPPSNLTLESRYPASLTVKWDSPSMMQAAHRYRLSIEAASNSYSAEYFVPGEKTTFNFSKLPDIVGTGELYTVKVEYIVTPTGSDQEVHSEPLLGAFTTKPLPPTNFRVVPETGEVCWAKSATPRVTCYKVRWKGMDEGSRAEEAIVPSETKEESTTCSFPLKDLLPSLPYKVNIYAMVEDADSLNESKELHEKVVMLEGVLAVYSVSEDMERSGSAASGALLTSRQNSNLQH